MNRAECAIVLASGGLDSTTLCYDLFTQNVAVKPVFVDYGQHCASMEFATLRKVLPNSLRAALVKIDVSDVYRNSNSRLIKEADLWSEHVDYRTLYLPYRSLLLLTIGAAHAQAHDHKAVYAAFINSNHAQEIDCSLEFFDRLTSLLQGYGGVELRLPYKNMSKLDVARRGIELGAPIGHTFSCQVSSEVPCGACPNCVDRLDALAALSGY